MTVLGRGLISQTVHASLLCTQRCTYTNDTIIALQNMLPLQISHQNYKKAYKHTILANVFNMALKLRTLHVQK